MKKDSKPSRLPGIAFATIVTTGMTIAICLAESRWYRVDTTKTADELNRQYGVTPVQARAMLAGMLRTWYPTRADRPLDGTPGKLAVNAEIRNKPAATS
jgi:hypothetical protein